MCSDETGQPRNHRTQSRFPGSAAPACAGDKTELAEVSFDLLARCPLARDYQRILPRVTGLPVQLLRPEASLTTSAAGPWSTPFCRILLRMGSGADCWQTHEREAHRLAGEQAAPQIRACFAGFHVVAVPIVIGARHVGTWVSGQVQTQPPTSQRFQSIVSQLAQAGVKNIPRALEAAFLRSVVMDIDQLQAVSRLLMFSALHLELRVRDTPDRLWLACKRGEPGWVTRAKGFIEAHPHEGLSLNRLAAITHTSPASLARDFREITGMPLPEYVLRLRINRAKALLAGSNLPLSRVAGSTGFACASQLDRMFRKYTGESPAGYRSRFSV